MVIVVIGFCASLCNGMLWFKAFTLCGLMRVDLPIQTCLWYGRQMYKAVTVSAQKNFGEEEESGSSLD